MSQATLKTAQVIPLRRNPAPVPFTDERGRGRPRERLLRFLAASLLLHAIVMLLANRPLPQAVIEPPPIQVRLAELPPVVPEMKPVPPPPAPAVTRPRPEPQTRPDIRPEPLPAPGPVAEPAPAPPPAVLTAIIVPELLYRDSQIDVSLTNVRLLAGLIAIVVAWRTKNALITIGATA